MKHSEGQGGYDVVLDTNIFISGIFWRGDSYKMLQLWGDGDIRVIISEEIIEEISRVLRAFKIRLPEESINRRIASIRENSIIVEPKEKFSIVEHSSDNKFIECAVAGNADYIITNDKHLLKIKYFRNILIMTPKEFLSI